ncbi:MAG TPA: hypothetical protein VK432_00930 [Stellaceae bacterium]|nr:hypothetical protein [Stellaceae bacterium]
MKSLVTLVLFLTWLMLGVAMTACSSDDVGDDYYENETHHGYPGPATTTLGRDQ